MYKFDYEARTYYCYACDDRKCRFTVNRTVATSEIKCPLNKEMQLQGASQEKLIDLACDNIVQLPALVSLRYAQTALEMGFYAYDSAFKYPSLRKLERFSAFGYCDNARCLIADAIEQADSFSDDEKIYLKNLQTALNQLTDKCCELETLAQKELNVIIDKQADDRRLEQQTFL